MFNTTRERFIISFDPLHLTHLPPHTRPSSIARTRPSRG